MASCGLADVAGPLWQAFARGSEAQPKEVNLEEYLDGRTVAYGQFQDRLGKVSQQFTVTIDGR